MLQDIAASSQIELIEDDTRLGGMPDIIAIETLHIRCSILLEACQLITNVSWRLSSQLEKKFGDHVDKILFILDQRRPYLSHQELTDFNVELDRLKRISQLYLIESHENFEVKRCYVQANYDLCKQLLFGINKYENDERVNELLNNMAEKVNAPVMTEEERRSVTQAMTSREGTGRWFRCPNGHYYYIGNCGGAMQTSRCNECNAEIGGSNHRLLNTNTFAGDIDGASEPAYPVY